MKKITPVFFSVVLLCIGSYANIMIMPGTDVTFKPIHHPGSRLINSTPVEVQMVSELVTADLYRFYALVTAEFNMKNCGEETSFQVGFPNTHGSLTDFAVSVDGMDTPVTKSSVGRSRSWNGWFLWDVTFAKNERKKIVVHYRDPLEISSSGILGRCYFRYILETGAGWHKDIERATVVVNLKGGLTSDQLIDGYNPSLDKATISKNEIRWNYENLEPSRRSNVFIKFQRHADYSEYVEIHRNDKFDHWHKVWKIAYACNKSGEYELAETILAEHCRLPNESDRYENARLSSDGLNLNKWEQMTMHRQLVLARYQLYLQKQCEKNEKRLRQALDRLKAWAVLDVDDPKIIEDVFHVGTSGEDGHQWLLTDYLVVHDATTTDDLATVRVFRREWQEKIEGFNTGK